MAIANPQIIKIKTFLKDSKYYIPEYQREYSWESKDQIIDFWKDLSDLIEGKRDYHFLGQIIVHKEKEKEEKEEEKEEKEEKLYIIDGQQRTSTSLILIAAFRKVFKELSERYNLDDAQIEEEDIRSGIIGRWTKSRDHLRLYLGKIDREFFREHIQLGLPILSNNIKNTLEGYSVKELDEYLKVCDDPSKERKVLNGKQIRKLSKISPNIIKNYLDPSFRYLDEPLAPSHIKIMRAHEYFYKKLRSLIDKDTLDPNEKQVIVNKWFKAFTERFKVLYLEVDSISEAFIVFETLNARGKALETSDLLKNHLLKTAGTVFVERVEKTWVALQEKALETNLTSFIRYFWNSKYSFSREKELYKELKKGVTKGIDSLNLVEELHRTMNAYKFLEDPETSNLYEEKIQKKIMNLKIMNAQTYYPIFLAMYNESFKKEDVLEVLTMLENFYFRNCIIAGKTANSYEVTFSKIAVKISKKEIDVRGIATELKKDLPNDKDFEELFKLATIKTHSVAKYMLREIVNYEQNEMIVNEDNKVIHLEHILPKKWEKWEKEDKDIRRSLETKLAGAKKEERKDIEKQLDELGEIFDFNSQVYKIGNLTLLFEELNKKAQNEVFKNKKKFYLSSEIPMTKALGDYSKWNADTIDKRQVELFETVQLIWKNPS
ncbi:DUF262 domain-containing protein [Priestia megaterium]|uniref:DUF262 domain-containing protein n=1 Tax=Priestia megaterium TaxID=1404 RepID=UPI000F1D2B1E|nr:DUF262 domain-containing HNH endonuclease family protein [Priestia megaterium]RMA90225.1 uncharacterized protein DUF1524 [Priestia megaterium]